ncbi:hypothetical protein [Asanoa siamensis]|uniref:Protein NO VEIN C-terminal domain-containing protein n=1 Tax=Asanoa siamensis TaxID=926357 RepID=A0ABQ4D004_9ACTN|nr:hypothetical protein [Asanoa siamensis]GIF76855.1 hypothetical protein Asi02nite_63730 [Asanoa siamensis]
MSGPLVGKAVENAAVAFVLRWEADHGRPARDTRGTGAAADVAGEVRTIEIKAYGQWARGQDLWLEPRQRDEALANPNFWIYVVENVRQGDPALFRLKTISGADLRPLLDRAVERRYFTVPWPVAHYDALAAEPPG